MPENQKVVKSFSSLSPKALIINEAGAIGSHLADSLMSFGCQTFYLGDKKKDAIDHLLDKSNFCFLKNLSGIQRWLPFSYVFYLTDSSAKSLSKVLTPFKESKTKFLLALPIKPETAQNLIKEIADKGIDFRICSFAEVYGPRINTGLFSLIIKDALSGEKIKINAQGTEEIPLVYGDDLIKGISRAMFSPETTSKVFFLGGEFTSPLNFLKELEIKTQKNFLTEFVKEGRVNDFSWPKTSDQDEINWRPETRLGEGIRETIDWFKLSSKRNSRTGKKRVWLKLKDHGFRRKKLIFSLIFFSFLTSLFFTLPLLLFLINIWNFKKNINLATPFWQKGELVSFRRTIDQAKTSLDHSRKIFNSAAPFYELFGLEGGVESLESVLDLSANMVNPLSASAEAIDLVLPLFSSLLKGEAVSLEDNLRQIDPLLREANLDLSMAENKIVENLQNGAVKFLGLEEYLFTVESLLPRLKQEVQRAQAILTVLPEVISENERRSYLVLLQDNLELRPTGGFVAAVGLLTFENGQLIDFNIQNTAFFDEKLRGQVDPPTAIKQYLGEKEWYLRDANWYPHFPATAEKAAWFYEKETGQLVDGVIGLNLETLRRIIAVTGEINIADYQEKINSQNILERVAYYSGNSSTPYLNQKLDLIGAIALELWVKAKSVDKPGQLKILMAVYDSLLRKDLLFSSFHPKTAEVARSVNWDGSIQANPDCQDLLANCLNDYLMINEANLGVNKVNYFLKRMISQKVVLSEQGTLSGTVKIFYQNLSLSGAWPRGDYQNFLRFYLPADSRLESVMINNPEDTGLWLEVPRENINFATESGRVNFGFLVNVPIKSARVVELKYFQSTKVDLSRLFSYLLLVQKQSGFKETPYSFTLVYPESIQPTKIIPKGAVLGGKVVINEDLDSDQIFRVDFSP